MSDYLFVEYYYFVNEFDYMNNFCILNFVCIFCNNVLGICNCYIFLLMELLYNDMKCYNL